MTFAQKLLGGWLPSLLWALAIALLVYGYYRVLSKKIYQRQAENAKYLARMAKLKSGWKRFWQRLRDAKDYKYFKCPSCRATLRVPRGKGKVAITCRKCGKRFEGKT